MLYNLWMLHASSLSNQLLEHVTRKQAQRNKWARKQSEASRVAEGELATMLRRPSSSKDFCMELQGLTSHVWVFYYIQWAGWRWAVGLHEAGYPRKWWAERDGVPMLTIPNWKQIHSIGAFQSKDMNCRQSSSSNTGTAEKRHLDQYKWKLKLALSDFTTYPRSAQDDTICIFLALDCGCQNMHGGTLIPVSNISGYISAAAGGGWSIWNVTIYKTTESYLVIQRH